MNKKLLTIGAVIALTGCTTKVGYPKQMAEDLKDYLYGETFPYVDFGFKVEYENSLSDNWQVRFNSVETTDEELREQVFNAVVDQVPGAMLLYGPVESLDSVVEFPIGQKIIVETYSYNDPDTSRQHIKFRLTYKTTSCWDPTYFRKAGLIQSEFVCPEITATSYRWARYNLWSDDVRYGGLDCAFTGHRSEVEAYANKLIDSGYTYYPDGNEHYDGEAIYVKDTSAVRIQYEDYSDTFFINYSSLSSSNVL